MKTRQAIKQWILKNCIDEDGNIDLTGLDFSDFDGDINISHMIVKKNLWQSAQNVSGNLFQDFQDVGKCIQQDRQTAREIHQSNQYASGNLYQENQSVRGKFINDPGGQEKIKSKKEIKNWIRANCINEWGDIDLTDLDFSDFDGDVDTSHMKVKNNLRQEYQEVGEDLMQRFQKVGGNLWQERNQVACLLSQGTQEVGGDLYQLMQSAGGNLYQNSQYVKGELIQDQLEGER